MHHDRAVLAYRIEHDRLFSFGRDFPHDVDGLCLQSIEMR